MVWWVLWTGCGGGSEARGVVTELCRWGQLSELTPTVLPADLDLAARVRDADLRYAKAERLAPSAENPFLALQQTVGLVADEPARALQQAVADHTHCAVEVDVQGASGTAHVTRVAPRPLDGQDLYVKVGELQKLGTQEERIARVGQWIAANSASATSEYDLKVEKQGDRWIVNFGLPEARLAECQAKLDEANATITKGRADEAQLAKLVILGTRWFEHASSSKNSGPRVDITVRNDLDTRVAKVEFHGVLTSPDREGPWIDDMLTHVPLGRFEPGDEDTWTIVSRLPARWRVRAPDGASLALTPVRLWGPKEALLYDVSALEDALVTAETMTTEIARVRTTYLGPE